MSGILLGRRAQNIAFKCREKTTQIIVLVTEIIKLKDENKKLKEK